MKRFSAVMAVCLLGLVLCDLQNEITEVAHEDLAHEDLAHEVLAHEDLAHEDLAHEVLAHEDLAHEVLAHEDLAQKDALQMLTESATTSTTCDLILGTVLKELGSLAADVRALEEKQATHVMALQETNQKMETRAYHIAFSATLSDNTEIGPVTILYSLIYGRVLTNIGGHYSPITGYFTARVRGVYFFTFTSHLWYGSSRTSGGSLYHNGNKVVSWFGDNVKHQFSSSNSAVLSLNVGDNVNVRLWEKSMISNNPNNYSTFSGFMLFSM